MILLDTNVVSEMMRAVPDRGVLAWMNQQATPTLALATPVVAEITFGIRSLPRGKRRRALEAGFERLLAEAFEGRIWDFDLAAAQAYGSIMSDRRAKGRPLSAVDGQLAAVARSRGASVATRNVRDLEGCGIRIIDPFRK